MKKKSWKPTQFIWQATFLLGLLFLALGLAWPVLADYLGPDRTVTTWTWERLHCEYFAMYDPPGSGYYGCYLHIYDTPSGSCPPENSTQPYFNPTACVGWPGTCGVDFSCSISLSSSIDGCSQGQQGCTSTSHTVTYPPATVSGSVACSQNGSDGWCVGTASLSVSASEPVGGYNITLIEGTHNGSGFSCPGASCEVSLLEGQNDFTYWAHSTFGDTSSMGSASGKVDSQPPQVSLTGPPSFCPGCGESLSVTLTVSDATSGVSSWTLTLDSAPLTSGSGSASQTVPVPSTGLSAGTHTLALSASDIAGNVNSTNLAFTLLLPTPTPTPTFTRTPTFTPLPTSTSLPPSTATHASSEGGGSQEDEPGSQSGSSRPQSTPTLGPSVTPGGEETILPTEGMDEELASVVVEDTEPEQIIGAGSGGSGAPMDSNMLSTLTLLGAAAGGLGAMAVYTLGKNPFGPGTIPVLNKFSLPQEAPNMVEVEYPYIHQWTEIRPDVLVEAYVGSKIEKVLVRAGFYMKGEPYTDFVTKTYPKSGSKEGTITKTIPYIAYEQIWVPPVYKGVVKDIYDYRPMEIIHEETRWREITVDAGNIPSELVKEFFKQMDPHLEFWEMEQKFQDFKETLSRLSLVIHEDNTKIVEQYLSDGIEMMVCINSSAYFYASTEAIEENIPGNIYRDALVTWTGNTYQSKSGNTYLEVKWNDHGKEKVGWVNAEYLILAPDNALSNQSGNVDSGLYERSGGAAQYIDNPYEIYLGDSPSPILLSTLEDLCGFWSVAYIGGRTISDVLEAVINYEIKQGTIVFEGVKQIKRDGKLIYINKYRIPDPQKSILYPALTNNPTSTETIRQVTNIVYGNPAELIRGSDFLPGLIRNRISEGYKLIMGVRVSSGTGNPPWIEADPAGKGNHFVAVTDVYYEADKWMVRWYDPWVDRLKTKDFDTFAEACYRFGLPKDAPLDQKAVSINGVYIHL